MTQTPGLAVHAATGPDGATVTAEGYIDYSTVRLLVDAADGVLRGGAHGMLTLDLSGVDFCDSAGISGLVRIRHQCDEEGWQLRVTGLRPPVYRMLVDLTGLGEFLNVG